METQEELAKAWAKGQPGLGLYLGCRAVRRADKGAGWDKPGRFGAGKGDLTVVTVENVVDGMARVSEEGGTSMGAPIDTLVLFKLAAPTDVKKLLPTKHQGNAVTGGRGHVGEADGTEKEIDNRSDLFSKRSKQAPSIPTSASTDLQDDAEEEESRYGVDWKPGVGTSSGNNWYDCMKFVAPVPAPDSSYVAKSTQGPLFQAGGTSNQIRRAGCRSRSTRREAQEPRRRVDSPTMEEMDSPTKKEGAEDVRHLLEQLKVARGTEGGEVEGGKTRLGELEGVAVALEEDHMKGEHTVNMEQTKSNLLERGPIVTKTTRNVEVFNVENAKARKAIHDTSKMGGPIEVETTGEAEGEHEAQVSDDEFDGENEAPASRIEDGNQEARLCESLAGLKSDQGAFLPTSLPTAASVSRWVEGDQLHKVMMIKIVEVV